MVIKFVYNSLNYKLKWIVTKYDEYNLVINKFSYDKCSLSLLYMSWPENQGILFFLYF